MKKNKYIILICIGLFISCTQPYRDSKTFIDYHDDLDTAWDATADYRYISETSSESWKNPLDFEQAGGGNCVGFSIYLMYRLGESSGSELLVIYEKVSKGAHAIVRYKGRYLEPQIKDLYYTGDEFVINKIYSFSEVMDCVYRGRSLDLDYKNFIFD